MTTYLTPPRGRDGRFRPHPEVGIARRMTAMLRAALGQDVLPDDDTDTDTDRIISQEKALGRFTRTVIGGIGSINWDPLLHPRDASGRFIEAGDRVTVDRGPNRVTIGQVVGNTPDGTIHVALPDGVSEEVDPGTVHVTGASGAARTIAPIPIRGHRHGRGTVDDPIDVGDDVDRAAALVADGKHIRLQHHDDVATLVDALADKARASQGGTIDLGLVTVAGTNLFTSDSIGASRVTMPQFTGVPRPGSPASTKPVAFTGDDGLDRVDITGDFIATLRARGIDVHDRGIPASHIRATQRDLSAATVAGIMDRIRGGRYVPAPLLVTRDGYLLDGHHRWAAMVALADTPDSPIPVTVIDLDVGATLDMARAFSAAMGMPVRGAPVRPPIPDGHPPTPYDAVTDEQWRRSLTGDEVAAVADLTEAATDDLSSTVAATTANDVLGNVVTVRGNIATGDGTEAGFYKATIRAERGVTLNVDSVIVYPQHRAHGFGDAWIRNVVATAREQGIDRITLNANVDVGGYVWAARGWEWDPDQRDRNAQAWLLMAQRLRATARRSDDPALRREVTATARRLERAARDPSVSPPTALEVAMLGHRSPYVMPGPTPIPMWPGKAAMLNTSWWGTLDLTPQEAVATKALGGIGHAVADIAWDPLLHPRDTEGQFTETLDRLLPPADPAPNPVTGEPAPTTTPRKAPPAPKSASMTPDEVRAYRTDRDTGRMRPDPATLTPPPGWHDVTTDEEREQIKQRLGRPLPPGFVRVWAMDDWSGPEKIKVNGFADNWKKQPVQGAAGRASSLDAKFARFRKVVAKRMPRLTRAARRDATSDDVALAVALMILTGARVGTTKGSAKEEHVGITSLRREHVTVDGDTVTLAFNAKGHANTYEFTDPTIAKALTRRLRGLRPGDEVFPDVTDDRTKRYIRQAMGEGAEDVINHDIRTAAANTLAAKVMAQLLERDGPPTTKAEAKRLKKAVATAVAQRLNDTVTVVVNNYIDPRVWATLGWEV